MDAIRPLLVRAEEATRQADFPTALACLLDAWRARHAPALREAIEAASDRAVATAPPVHPEDWEVIARQQAPATLPLLLSQLGTDSAPQAAQRLALLESWPADPRLASFLARWVEELVFRSPDTRPLWRRVFNLLEAIADPAVADALERASFIDRRGDIPFPDWYQRRLQRTLETLRARPTERLPEPEASACRRLLGQIHINTGATTNRHTEHLFEAVYQNPADDDLRLVLADALIENGDPRGEFIMLQMQEAQRGSTRRTRRRMRKLLQRHQGEWLGDLRDVLGNDDIEFERGFVVSGTVVAALPEVRRVLGSPGWSTLEELRAPTEVLVHPSLRALRRIEPDAHQIHELIQHPGELAFTHVCVSIDVELTARRALRLLDKLPDIHTFDATHAPSDVWRPIVADPSAHRVTVLRLRTAPADIGDAVGHCQDSQIQQLDLLTHSWEWTWHRSEGALDRVAVEYAFGGRAGNTALVELEDGLRSVPAFGVRSFKLRAPDAALPHTGSVRAILEQLAPAKLELPPGW